MNWFYNLKISVKLLSSFILVALITAFVGYFAITNMKTLDARDTLLYTNYTKPISEMSDVSTAYQRLRVNTRDLILADNQAEQQEQIKRIGERKEDINKSLTTVENTLLSQEAKNIFKNIQDAKSKYFSGLEKFLLLANSEKIKEAEQLLKGELAVTAKDIDDAINQMVNIKNTGASTMSDENTAIFESSSKTLIIIIVISAIFSIFLGIFISRIISNPLKSGVEMFQEMQKGILGKRLHMTTKDEIGTLAQTMDQFADDLQNVVVGTMKKISEGDLSSDIVTKDSRDEITPALRNTIESLRGLVSEAKMLTKAAVEGKLSTRGNAEKFKGGYKEIVEGVNATLDSVIGPLNVAAEYVDRISKGDIPKKITDNYNGDFNEIKNNLNNCIDAVNMLVSDAGVLSKAAVEGKLSTRADASKHQGDYRKIVEGVNATLDSVIGPLNVAAEYVDRISKGDLPKKITDNYNGDFNEIKNNLNNCIDNINALVTDAGVLVKAAVDGKLSTRADASKHQGDYRKIVEGVNSTLDSVIGPLNVAAEYVDRISKGDMPKKITDNYNGDFNEIKNNLNNCIDNITSLVHDADMLSKAAVDGKLSTRADASKHQGDYRKIVEGVNSTLDSVIGPLNVAAEYVDRISKGDIPKKITDTYNGDFNEIKNNLNNCIDAVNLLVSDAGVLSKAAVDGKLSTRADASKHQGDFKKIVEGVNATLDSVIGPLNVAAEYVDRISKGDLPNKITDNYNGDFNEIKNNLNNCIDNINALVTDAGILVKAAIEGKLSTRADASKHEGDFKKIVDGVNSTLDSVIGPLNVAAEYVDRISKGDIPEKITDTYNGDFNKIKNNLNTCIDAVDRLVADADMLAKAAIEGRLSTRADASKHSGDFKKIVDGVNETLNKVIDPVNEAVEVIQKMAMGDLGGEITGEYQGDHATLKNAINGTLESLNDILSQVMTTVTQVMSGSHQVSDASQSLSQGATEQASSLEEITSSMTEIGAQTKLNAENANQANQLSQVARNSAEKGNKEMDQLMQAMNEITESSKNISKIIKVIDEIAFQTNLLALNAAVEAARAGRHGKGFAVVAEEVRNLAARSAKAAKETAEMIEGSIKRVENGSAIATRTSEALGDIQNGATKVTDIVGEIAASSNEQATSVSQVNTGLTQIDKVTQQNTANAEESASAAEELSGQANQLNEMIRRFKLRNGNVMKGGETVRMISENVGKKHLPVNKEQKIKMATPRDIINLDDSEFGKF